MLYIYYQHSVLVRNVRHWDVQCQASTLTLSDRPGMGRRRRFLFEWCARQVTW